MGGPSVLKRGKLCGARFHSLGPRDRGGRDAKPSRRSGSGSSCFRLQGNSDHGSHSPGGALPRQEKETNDPKSVARAPWAGDQGDLTRGDGSRRVAAQPLRVVSPRVRPLLIPFPSPAGGWETAKIGNGKSPGPNRGLTFDLCRRNLWPHASPCLSLIPSRHPLSSTESTFTGLPVPRLRPHPT